MRSFKYWYFSSFTNKVHHLRHHTSKKFSFILAFFLRCEQRQLIQYPTESIVVPLMQCYRRIKKKKKIFRRVRDIDRHTIHTSYIRAKYNRMRFAWSYNISARKVATVGWRLITPGNVCLRVYVIFSWTSLVSLLNLFISQYDFDI